MSLPMDGAGATEPCPNCGQALIHAMVRTAFWREDQLFAVEDVPALACLSCGEQLYDDDVTEALQRLNDDGFPAEAAHRQLTVPVFSLKDRIHRLQVTADDDS